MSSDNSSAFAAFIEALPVAAFAVDEQGKVNAWSSGMSELTGQDASVALGKKAWSSLLSKRAATPIDDALSNAELVDVPFRITRGGTGVDVRFRAKPLIQPGEEEPHGAVAVLSPVSEAGRQGT